LTDPLRELALKIVWLDWGKPYRWGGDDPGTFDCSGKVIEWLKSVGFFPRKKDTTADGLRRLFQLSVVEELDDAQPCDLIFFMNRSATKAIHVETIVKNIDGDLYSIGASGGGSDLVSPGKPPEKTGDTTADTTAAIDYLIKWVRRDEAAWEQNAYVKVRPVASIYPNRVRVLIDPFAMPVEDVT